MASTTVMIISYLAIGAALSLVWIVWGYRTRAKLEFGLVPMAMLVWPLLLLAYGFGKLSTHILFFARHGRPPQKHHSGRRAASALRAIRPWKRGSKSNTTRSKGLFPKRR